MSYKHYSHLLLLCAILIGFTSCFEDEIEPYYTQPNRDDLAFLHFNEDSILFTGQTIQYLDTLHYNYNDSVSIQAVAKTTLYYTNNPWGNPAIKSMNGKTTLMFDTCSAIKSAEISFIRYYGVQASTKNFIVKSNGINDFNHMLMPGYDDSTFMDTSRIRGVLYPSVIKFYPSEEFETNLKSVFFAKGHGFIRIETNDGDLLELTSSEN